MAGGFPEKADEERGAGRSRGTVLRENGVEEGGEGGNGRVEVTPGVQFFGSEGAALAFQSAGYFVTPTEAVVAVGDLPDGAERVIGENECEVAGAEAGEDTAEEPEAGEAESSWWAEPFAVFVRRRRSWRRQIRAIPPRIKWLH